MIAANFIWLFINYPWLNSPPCRHQVAFSCLASWPMPPFVCDPRRVGFVFSDSQWSVSPLPFRFVRMVSLQLSFIFSSALRRCFHAPIFFQWSPSTAKNMILSSSARRPKSNSSIFSSVIKKSTDWNSFWLLWALLELAIPRLWLSTCLFDPAFDNFLFWSWATFGWLFYATSCTYPWASTRVGSCLMACRLAPCFLVCSGGWLRFFVLLQRGLAWYWL